MKNYKLTDFGRDEYKDRLDPITTLTILIAFTIPLFVESFKNYHDLTVAVSLFSGGLVLIFYMLYTVDYYEKIWNKWYALPDDLGFFRVYSLVTGVIVIALMQVFPEFWYWYLSVLFLILTLKKLSTKRLYVAAFNYQYESFNKCEDKRVKCVYLLAENMSHNFLVFGFVISFVASVLLTLLYYYDFGLVSFDFNRQHLSVNVSYTVACLIYTFVLVGFWYKKIKTGISYIASEVERGNTDFFEKENR